LAGQRHCRHLLTRIRFQLRRGSRSAAKGDDNQRFGSNNTGKILESRNTYLPLLPESTVHLANVCVVVDEELWFIGVEVFQ
jgi:hypothetical protein